jgi:Lrp/AsnC family leucine-responsive transcriptional regulator
MASMDDIDRQLLRLLQEDATTPYTALGERVGLSSAAAHERVRKLRQAGVVRRTTVDVDPQAVGAAVTAFVLVEAGAWVGDEDTAAPLAGIAEVEEAHVVAGDASLLLKLRAGSTRELQRVLRELHALPAVRSLQTVVVLETFFERPLHVPPE